MTDGDCDDRPWHLPSREASAATATDAVDGRDVLDHVDALTVYAWEAPEDDGGAWPRVSPAAEDVADGVVDGGNLTASDVDGMCLAAIQGLRQLATEHRDRIERQEATIREQRDDIETLRERVEALQATMTERRRESDATK